jgi:type IV pilus assembly protein PilE
MKGGLAMRTHSFRVARAARGVTLLELLIVVTLLGILAAIAVPSYWAYIVRGQRAAAKTALMQAAQYLERNYTSNGCYQYDTQAACQIPAGANLALPAVLTNAPTDGGAFTYAIGVAFPTAQSYTLTATPLTTFTDNDCGALTLDNTGAKTASGTLGADPNAPCWQR